MDPDVSRAARAGRRSEELAARLVALRGGRSVAASDVRAAHAHLAEAEQRRARAETERVVSLEQAAARRRGVARPVAGAAPDVGGQSDVAAYVLRLAVCLDRLDGDLSGAPVAVCETLRAARLALAELQDRLEAAAPARPGALPGTVYAVASPAGSASRR